MAIVGSGLTGIASAAHLLSRGFEVTIYTLAQDESELGGIWSRVNSTSGLQISSVMYRFFPSVCWSTGYPHRDEILGNIRSIARNYHILERIKWATPVEKVERDPRTSTDPEERGHARWIVNGETSTVYDGILVATGTCGKPKMLDLPGQDSFHGKIVHSSSLDALDEADLKGKKVVVVGGGASGVEALELAVTKGADKVTILARSDKWFIPRNTVVDCLLACQPLGRETRLTPIVEFLLRKLHYRDLEQKMAPTGLPFYSSTPVVNDRALKFIRQGRGDYLRGDLKEVTHAGVKFSHRERGTKPGDKGFEQLKLDADIVVVATGFEKPSIGFLPDDLFPEDYTRPNMYLQVFPIKDVSVACINATFKDAVGTVGNWHIGIITRILSVFLMDPSTRPLPKQMRTWVDVIQWAKESSRVGGLDFFTYTELVLWVSTWLLFRASRIKYAFYVLFGYGFWTHDQESLRGEKSAAPQDLKRSFHLSLSKLAPRFYGHFESHDPAEDYVRVISQFGGPALLNVDVAERGARGENEALEAHPDGEKFIPSPPILGQAADTQDKQGQGDQVTDGKGKDQSSNDRVGEGVQNGDHTPLETSQSSDGGKPKPSQQTKEQTGKKSRKDKKK